ncbi:CDP-alcohol phosphatidyltransferase family protein [Geopsychrobacter electrodiphilus]|uniref:CDP-alcohol phosphatidyltransferase family protein n=1 Tax=Geopsychrobacter electrodiphilus TaxID=225196 RepID=UPI0003691469|nr:CDP-alcohol phosphatidyltransferase family protein [Geopsychrobacter electrodiphilus]
MQKHRYLYLQILTASRIFLAAILASVFAVYGLNAWTILAAAILGCMAELTDLFDGMLARKYGLTSDFGKFFDPYTDSIARLIMFFALAYVHLVPLWLPVVMALRDVSVSYIRLFAMKEHVVMASRLSGKIKAWAQGVGFFLLLLIGLLGRFDLNLSQLVPYIALFVLLVTLWSLFDYAAYLFYLVRKKTP